MESIQGDYKRVSNSKHLKYIYYYQRSIRKNMNNKFYNKMDIKIDSDIKNARANRKKFYVKQEVSLKSSDDKYEGEVSFKEICDNNRSLNDKFSVFEFKSYNFVSFKDTKWGKHIACNEEDYIEVRRVVFFYVDFTNCEFKNVIFNGCKFIGCRFDNCTSTSGKVIFETCVLRWIEMENNDNIVISTEFIECSLLQIDIRNSHADALIFDKCTIMRSLMIASEMPDTIFNSCSFYGLIIESSKINGVKIKGTTNYELRFHGTTYEGEADTDVYISKPSLKGYNKSILTEYQKYKESNTTEMITKNEFICDKYSNVAKLFYTIHTVLKTSNFNDDYTREYSYMYNKYLMKSKQDFGDRFVLKMSWGLFGFGERMGRFLFWTFGYVFIFAVTYMFTGINNSSGEVIKYVLSGGTPVPVKELLSDFFQCMHFSIITFSTVGYGNITPYGWSLLVSALQVISGIALVALFTSVIVKKFLR